MQSRLGLEAVRGFYEEICPLLGVVWVGEELHRRAAAALITANRRNLSLVDCVSFEVMRDLGVKSAFAFDPHFDEMGFDCMP